MLELSTQKEESRKLRSGTRIQYDIRDILAASQERFISSRGGGAVKWLVRNEQPLSTVSAKVNNRRNADNPTIQLDFPIDSQFWGEYFQNEHRRCGLLEDFH